MCTYEIYQLKRIPENRDISFESMDHLKIRGIKPEATRYEKVYSGTTSDDTTLEDIFFQFNMNRPLDFTGHSLSVSDVVVLNGEAHYVDDFGFQLIPDFF